MDRRRIWHWCMNRCMEAARRLLQHLVTLAEGEPDERGDRCRCAPRTRQAYLGRLSGPLLDRVDVQVEDALGIDGYFDML